MDKENLIFFSAVGLVGYAVFHGHRLGTDCWLCKYRGLIFLSSAVGLGVFFGYKD